MGVAGMFGSTNPEFQAPLEGWPQGTGQGSEQDAIVIAVIAVIAVVAVVPGVPFPAIAPAPFFPAGMGGAARRLDDHHPAGPAPVVMSG